MQRNSTFEEAAAKGNFVIQPHGISMWPMLRNGKDSVVIDPAKGRLEKYDIPLYKDSRGRYVIHRIVEVTPTGYVICGDGLYTKEFDITDEHILGCVSGFFRKEKFISCDSRWYRLYAKFWVNIYFLRKPILWCSAKWRRVKEIPERIKKGKR